MEPTGTCETNISVALGHFNSVTWTFMWSFGSEKLDSLPIIFRKLLLLLLGCPEVAAILFLQKTYIKGLNYLQLEINCKCLQSAKTTLFWPTVDNLKECKGVGFLFLFFYFLPTVVQNNVVLSTVGNPSPKRAPALLDSVHIFL